MAFAYRFSICALPFLRSRHPWYSAYAATAPRAPGGSKISGDSFEEANLKGLTEISVVKYTKQKLKRVFCFSIQDPELTRNVTGLSIHP